MKTVYETAVRKVGNGFVTEYILSGEPFVLDLIEQFYPDPFSASI